MSVTPGYKTFVIGQLQQIAHISWRRMFGGIGFYADEFFFALIGNDRLYFKVDDSNRADFEERGMEAFHPYGDERALSYYEVPIEVLEDVDELKIWCEKAVAVSKNSKSNKKRSRC